MFNSDVTFAIKHITVLALASFMTLHRIEQYLS